MGYDLGLVTVTSYIRAAFYNSGVNFEPICEASPFRLSEEERSKWGKYYSFSPQTGFIDLKRLDFLDEVAGIDPHTGEMKITLGCFGMVGVV